MTGSEAWLTVSPATVDNNGLGSYTIAIDRQGLAAGSYSGSITAVSSVNSLTIEVLMTVGGSTESDLGVVYILLYNIDEDVVIAETATRARDGRYPFNFTTVPAGRYQVIAGTDLDNDLFICDPGEACGSWLTIDQPLAIDLNQDRQDIVFPIEYLVAIPTLGSYQETPAAADNTFRRKPIITVE